MADEKLRIILEAEADKALGPLKQVGEQLNKTGAAAGKFNRSLAGTNTTLTNFGRVLQDAPFGLIGIANNIDPLLSSFQQLKRESGSAGSALKALGAGLLGPAGIAIGVSAVTSALIAFGPQISAAISGVNKFEQAQRDAAEKGAGAFIEAQQEFSKFSTIVSDSGNSFARQNDALKDANNLLGDYGLKIKDVATFQKIGAQVGLLYAEIKQEEAKAAVLAAKAAEAYAKNVVLGIKAQQGDVGIIFDFKAGDLIKNLTGAITPLEAVKQLTDGFSNAIQANNQEQQAFQKEADKTQSSVSELINKLKNITGITEDFGEKTKKAKVENNRLALQELSQTEAVTRALSEQEKALQRLINARKKDAINNSAEQIFNAANNLNNAPTAIGNIRIPQGIADEQARINQEAAIGAQQFAAIQASVAQTQAIFNTLGPVIDQTFAAIANGQNAFDAIGQALKRLIVDLVKAAALAAVLAAVTGGTGAGFGGAFLSQFKSLLGFRANGGPVAGPTIVGERGPELFVPNTSGSIVSNTNLRSGDGGGTLTARIAGNDLLILLDRAQRQRRRLGG